MEEAGQPGTACTLPVPFPHPWPGRQQCPWGRAGAGTRLQDPRPPLRHGRRLHCLHPHLCPCRWRGFCCISSPMQTPSLFALHPVRQQPFWAAGSMMRVRWMSARAWAPPKQDRRTQGQRCWAGMEISRLERDRGTGVEGGCLPWLPPSRPPFFAHKASALPCALSSFWQPFRRAFPLLSGPLAVFL